MCEAARITNLDRKWLPGDWYAYRIWNGEFRVKVTDGEWGVDLTEEMLLERIWLPRQDQLAEMIETWNKKYSIAFFQNIVSNSKYRGIPSKGVNSIEKHLLTFFVKERDF